MRIGQIFRYSETYAAEPHEIDGLPNYFWETHTSGRTHALLMAGINPIQRVRTPDGPRCPAVLIASSPHRTGSRDTPWQDFFDPDNGHIRYCGDNKNPGRDPSTTKGNRALLEQFALHDSPDRSSRAGSSPIVCFERVAVGSRAKGNVQFQGFGVITRAERITQHDRRQRSYFANYVFDIAILSQTAESEEFDWAWISARRDSESDQTEVLQLAPQSWKTFVLLGKAGIEKCRRRVSKLLTLTAAEQKPRPSSKEASALSTIYRFYDHRKSRFEALAASVAAAIIRNGGLSYKHGWITQASSDGGADFVGRLDIGSGIAGTRLVVLGQAKCERPDTATGGNHIARTVARLKRGWVGIYVTTSYFSEAVQREVIEDKYPIILVHGLRLASEVLSFVNARGLPDVETCLASIDQEYESQLARRDPEEILLG